MSEVKIKRFMHHSLGGYFVNVNTNPLPSDYVEYSDYDRLQSELKAKDELLRECEKALEHYANKRISEGGTARAYFEKWKKDAKT